MGLFHNDDDYKPLPAGCDGQGRYRTRHDDPVIALHRNGQPVAGEAVADDDPPVERKKWDGPLGFLLIAMSAVAVCIIGVHLVARVLG